MPVCTVCVLNPKPCTAVLLAVWRVGQGGRAPAARVADQALPAMRAVPPPGHPALPHCRGQSKSNPYVFLYDIYNLVK